MSGLAATYKIAEVAVNTATAAVFAVNAPANQKCRIGVNVFCKDPTGASMVRVELRRRGTDDGTKSAAITWIKVNPLNTETVQTQGYTYTVQPTNDGTAVRQGLITSQRNIPFPPFEVEGGGKYTVFVTTTANVTIGGEITLEE